MLLMVVFAFFNLFSGLDNRDLVLHGGFRVLGEILFLDGVIHLHDVRDDLAASISDFAVTQDQLLDILLHQIQRRDHFERVVGVFFSEFPAESLAGLPVGS